MNWLWVGIGMLIFGVIWVLQTMSNPSNSTANNSQTGYLFTLFGTFAIIAQYISIGDTMFIFVTLTALTILADKFYFCKHRHPKQKVLGWIIFSRSFFPVLGIVFLIRGFVVEPYQVPSSSMRPGLIPGDFILVNKFIYGLRLPLSNKVLIPISLPQRGDVIVFNYPNDNKVNYIKRVIGLPGDTISYRNKQLSVNGSIAPITLLSSMDHYSDNPGKIIWADVYKERQQNKQYRILIDKTRPTIDLAGVQEFAARENCHYDETGFTCVVPAGHYFAMGDNRDHSGDSRYWGFIADKHLVGKAFLIWLNLSALSRVGEQIR